MKKEGHLRKYLFHKGSWRDSLLYAILKMNIINKFIYKLKKEVYPLFGTLVNLKEFQEGINDCIKNKNAYWMEYEEHNEVGIIVLNRKEYEDYLY